MWELSPYDIGWTFVVIEFITRKITKLKLTIRVIFLVLVSFVAHNFRYYLVIVTT